ncbi:hypothetical protein D9M68_928050 [compost metagenome]
MDARIRRASAAGDVSASADFSDFSNAEGRAQRAACSVGVVELHADFTVLDGSSPNALR